MDAAPEVGAERPGVAGVRPVWRGYARQALETLSDHLVG